MNAAELARRKHEVIEVHGPWTAHNLHLGAGVYTRDPDEVGGSESRLRRILQTTSDLMRRDFTELRVADLAALEGGFSVEFAARGSKVLAIEGRSPSIAKIQFAKEALGLANLEIVQDDVRGFSRERYGAFDVVIASGILYHLDSPDIVPFLSRVAQACDGVTVIDTEVSGAADARDAFEHVGLTYKGFRYEEPTGPALNRDVLWSSLDNELSFCMTRASLLNALGASGFTTALECHLPTVKDARPERATFVAVRGSRQKFASIPPLDHAPLRAVPEYEIVLSEHRYRRAMSGSLRKWIPAAVRRPLKQALARAGLRAR